MKVNAVCVRINRLRLQYSLELAMPYVFYDTETTGTETAFDQILQFAAIKTDDDLNELDR